MKSLKNKILYMGTLFLLFLVVIGFNSIQVKAADDTFTITFRAGILGEIDTDSFYKVDATVGDSLADILNTNDILNKITVKSPTEYYVEPVAMWKMNSEAIGTKTVNKDCDIVISYGRLIDSAEYIVKYLDIDTGVQVAKPIIARGEDQYLLTISPLAGIANYTLISPTTNQDITLDNTKLNEVIFYYRSTLKGNVTENFSYQTLPDETVTTTETVDTIIYNPVAVVGGGSGNAQGNATEIEDEDVALEDTIEDTNEDDSSQDSADSNEDEANDDQMIEDEEVPLESGTRSNIMLPMITGIICFLGLAVMVGVYVIYRRKAYSISEEPDQTTEEDTRGKK